MRQNVGIGTQLGKDSSPAPKGFGDNRIQTPSSSFNYYGFPMWRKEFKDLRTRQAIWMAIDRNTINSQLPNNAMGGWMLNEAEMKS